MNKYFPTVALFVLFSASAVLGQTKSLTNSDVAEMIKGGLPESTIILSIQQSKPNFDLSPEALIKLKKDGATQNVLDAMLRAAPPGNAGTYSEDAFGTSVGSSVVLVDGERRTPMKRMTPTSKTNNAVRAIPYVGIFMKGKTYAVFNGPRSEIRTGNPTPEFELGISSDLKISDAVYLIKLDPQKSTRRSEVERMGDLGGSSGTRKKDMIPISIQEIDRKPPIFGISFYRIKPNAAIAPGEYALVLNGNLFYDFGVDLVP